MGPSIYFVGSRSGSFNLRGIQMTDKLCELGYDAKYFCLDLPNSKQFDWRSFANSKGNIIIFVKGVTKLDGLAMLQLIDHMRKHNVIILDMVEPIYFIVNPVWQQTIKKYNAIIVPNHLTKNDIEQIYPLGDLCRVIYHHWDVRLPKNINISTKNRKFELVHSGTKDVFHKQSEPNCLYLDRIPEIIHVNNIAHDPWNRNREVTQAPDNETRKDFSCHYSVRNPESSGGRYKSNIKLSNAAFLNANIIISRDATASELLSDDYPYWTETDFESVQKTIKYAQQTFDKEIWNKGLSMLNKVTERTSIDRISQDYIKLFNDLSQNPKLTKTK